MGSGGAVVQRVCVRYRRPFFFFNKGLTSRVKIGSNIRKVSEKFLIKGREKRDIWFCDFGLVRGEK